MSDVKSIYLVGCELESLQRESESIDRRIADLLKKMKDEVEKISTPADRVAMEKEYRTQWMDFTERHTKEEKTELGDLKESAPALVEKLFSAYQQTENSLFLWRIYRVCRLAGQPVPELVLFYLDLCAYNLLEKANETPLSDTITKKKSRSNEYAGEDCLKALQLHKKGKLNAFSAMRKYWAQHALMSDIEVREKENLANGMKETDARINAIRTVHIAQNKVFKLNSISYQTLYSYYVEHKKNISSSKI